MQKLDSFLWKADVRKAADVKFTDLRMPKCIGEF